MATHRCQCELREKGYKSKDTAHKKFTSGWPMQLRFRNLQKSRGNRRLHTAVKDECTHCLDAVLSRKEPKLDVVNSFGETPLIYGLRTGAGPEVLKLLIDRNCNVILQDCDGLAALHHACRRKTTAVAVMLLEKGADVDVEDDYGHTPLYIAMLERRYQIAALLMCYNADVNKEFKPLYNPIITAIEERKRKWILLLIDFIDDINRQYEGYTALFLAAKASTSAICKDILERGGDANYTVDGKPCVYMALDASGNDNFKVIWEKCDQKLLLNSDVDLLTYFFYYCRFEELTDKLETLEMIFSSPYINDFIDWHFDRQYRYFLETLGELKYNVPRVTLYRFLYDVLLKHLDISNRIKYLHLFLSHSIPIYEEEIVCIYDSTTFEDVEAILEVGVEIRPSIYDETSLEDYWSRKSVLDNQKELWCRVLYNKPTSRYNIYPEEYLRFYRCDNPLLPPGYNGNVVPTLFHLSRDEVRNMLYGRFLQYGSSKVYRSIRKLPVSTLIQDILLLKQPLTHGPILKALNIVEPRYRTKQLQYIPVSDMYI